MAREVDQKTHTTTSATDRLQAGAGAREGKSGTGTTARPQSVSPASDGGRIYQETTGRDRSPKAPVSLREESPVVGFGGAVGADGECERHCPSPPSPRAIAAVHASIRRPMKQKVSAASRPLSLTAGGAGLSSGSSFIAPASLSARDRPGRSRRR